MDPNEEEEISSSNTKTKKIPNYPGPKEGVSYPITVLYCGECTLPVDLCENSPNPEACKDWLEKHHPDFYTKLNNLQISNDNEQNDSESGEKKSTHQKRGGKGTAKPKKEKIPSKIIVTKDKRRGNKFVTIITGLNSNDIDLDVARKFFAQRFACACSKGEGDEIVIQGDVVDSLFDVIPEKFQIDAKMIEEKETKAEKK